MDTTCRSCKKKFSLDPEDAAMYAKFDVSELEECRDCRLKHIFAFWAFGVFRKTTSGLSGKGLITNLPETVPYPIYDRNEWISDEWDPMTYGKEYDPGQSFLEQFASLRNQVPHPHRTGLNSVNSEWCDDVWNCKNCYLCRSLEGSEDLSYAYRVIHSTRSIDLAYCFDMDASYDCVYCFKCYKTRYAFDSRNCIESSFLYDCRNVRNCFMCWNLRNKEYHILNQPYSKEEYFEKIKEFDMRSFTAVEKMKQDFAARVVEDAIHRQNFNTQVTASSGNFITECKNCADCYFGEQSENCRSVFRYFKNKDSIDCVGGYSLEQCALCCAGGLCFDVFAAIQPIQCRYSAYLEYCEECEYCFGCVGLRKKKYCILNKQYAPEEYEATVARIKEAMRRTGEWGRFFPWSEAGFGYNLSVGELHMPESKEEILGLGGIWHDFKDEVRDGMDADMLPDRIDDARDEIATTALICPMTKRRFNIAPHELQFYRQEGIPLPRRHFDWRTIERFRPLTLAAYPSKGTCFSCGKDIEHFFPTELGYRKIACVDCYQREVS